MNTVAASGGGGVDFGLRPAVRVLLERAIERRQVVEDIADERVHDERVQVRIDLQKLAEAEAEIAAGVTVDFSDPGGQETFKKIDAFLSDPSTGVIRELPARRVKVEES